MFFFNIKEIGNSVLISVLFYLQKERQPSVGVKRAEPFPSSLARVNIAGGKRALERESARD